MKAITITQPYATLIALGEKCIETRSWHPRYTGPIAIHAAKNWPNADREWQFKDPDWVELLKRIGHTGMWHFPLGAIVATANLAAVVRMDRTIYDDPPTLLVRGHTIPLTEQEEMLGNYQPGRYAWIFTNVLALPKPIVCRGHLGLWEFEESLEEVA